MSASNNDVESGDLKTAQPEDEKPAVEAPKPTVATNPMDQNTWPAWLTVAGS